MLQFTMEIKYKRIVMSPFLGAVGPLTKLVLVNALYFKGTWKSPFEPSVTKIQPFFTASNEKPTHVNMMHKYDYFHCGIVDSLDARILELPFKVCDKLHM